MRHAIDLLVSTPQYHRDRRNITTHFVGIPLIVFAIGVLLARARPRGRRLALTPAWSLGAVDRWYLTRGNFVLGAATSAGQWRADAAGPPVAAGGIGVWLAWAWACSSSAG